MKALPEGDLERVTLAVDTAAKMGIQKVLDPDEITSRTDQHSMMVYVSYFRDHFNDKLAEALDEKASSSDERAEAARAAAAMEEAARVALVESEARAAREAEEAERLRLEEEKEAERQREEAERQREEAERQRLEAEKEAARLAAEQEAELERQRLEREERERILLAERDAAIAAAAAAELAAAQASLEEKIERERIAAEAQAEVERLQREDRERREREELERLEKERQKREKLEQERQEKERLEKAEQERIEKERMEKEERERLEREERERVEREQRELEAAEEAKRREEAEAIALAQQREAERLEQERLAAEKHAEDTRLFIAQTHHRKSTRGFAPQKEGAPTEKKNEARTLPQIESRGGIMCLATDGIPIISPNGRIDLGLLRMCVWYDNVKHMLMVGLSSGLCLPPMDSNGFSDPFVKLRLVPERKTKRWKSKVLKKTLNPVFMQVHSFPLLPSHLDDTRLIVDCFDYDFAAADDFIGLVDVPLQSVTQIDPANLKHCDCNKLETWVDPALYDIVRWYALQPEDAGFKRPSGSIPFENDCWKYADGSSKLPSGIFQLGDGSIADSFRYNGKLVFAKLSVGARYLEDGSVLQADGTIVLPSGAVIRLDGNLRLPDGSIKAPAWAIPHHPLPAGFMQLPDFSFTGPHEGKRMAVVEPPGSNLGLTLGCVKLAARYYSNQSKILLKLERCAGLPAMDRNGFSDPYVVIQMIDTAMGPFVGKQNSITRERETELAAGQVRPGDERAQVVLAERRTTVIKKTLNPRWDGEFGFSVKRRQLGHREIIIEVWDWDMGAADDFIGGTILKCSQMKVDVKESECLRWYALQRRDEGAKTRVFLNLPPSEEAKPLPSII
jgi:hypothetical protein